MARPVELIVAAFVFDEAQVAVFVKSCVVLSEKVPVALNCSVLPAGTELFAGATAIDTNVAAAVTLRLVEPVTVPCFAEMVADCPAVTPVAKPVELIVAAAVFDDAQVTEVVKS